MVTEERSPVGPGVRPGSVLAGYRLEEEVGRGGMAVVYRAREVRLNRSVALKIFAPQFPANTPKSDFPAGGVYGATADAELRLITCSGAFDSATGHYVDNIIVYATEVS